MFDSNMIVYRVETEVGTGFYRALQCTSLYAAYDAFTDPVIHPVPEDDGISAAALNRNYHDHVFGFCNRKQLQRWFGTPKKRWIDDVAELYTLFITAYDIDIKFIIHGKSQCMFKRSAAKKLDLMLPFTYDNINKFGEM